MTIRAHEYLKVSISSLCPGDWVRSWGKEDVLVKAVLHQGDGTGTITIQTKDGEHTLTYEKDFMDLQRRVKA